MRKYVIGLCGMTLSSVNFGVGALGLSHLKVIDECIKNKGYMAEYIFFSMEKPKNTDVLLEELGVKDVSITYVDSARLRAGIRGLIELIRNFKKCDIVFDVTQGDSFSDIYGMNRYILTSIEKFLAINVTKKLVLSPQTIGPFKNKICKDIAKYFMNKSLVVYARDEISYNIAKNIAPKAAVKQTSDMAFFLPYKEEKQTSDKIKIGLNVSGLLWQRGYTGNNEFGLDIDYKKYINELIEWILKNEKYEIYLIGHVFLDLVGDDDYKILMEIKEMYKDNNAVILARRFRNPMEAKGFISGMDIFIGARMHSTIAAISTGVATIPVSYSRKFEGLYRSIDYNYVIEACELGTEEALKRTIEEIKKYLLLKKDAQNSLEKANQKNSIFKKYIQSIL